MRARESEVTPPTVPGGREPPAVEVRNVSKRFGRMEVVRDVSLQVAQGESRGLVGRNGAGKSTLVAMMTGLLAPSNGLVFFLGSPAPAMSDRAGWRASIACVYQRWTVIPELTVAENLFLNDQPRNALGLIRWKELEERARSTLLEWDLDVDPRQQTSRLTVEQRQIVEIGRALLQGSRLIVLDEPTAEMERREVTRLFDRLKRLQSSGVTFIYISHHLDEVYEICGAVSVLRDGRLVADAPLSNFAKSELVQAMVGDQSVVARARQTREAEMDIALDVANLAIDGVVDNVNLQLSAGGCLGLAGLAGSGKEEVGEAIAGLRKDFSGSITLADPSRAVGYVPRDRHARGILPQLSVGENLTATIINRFGKAGFILPRRQFSVASSMMARFGIVAANHQQPIEELSGGNQQKAVVGRALASEPKVLILNYPTQGVDIASKNALFRITSEAQDAGTAILLISDDLDELSICDEVQVIVRGRLTRRFGWQRDDKALVAAIEGAEEGSDG